MCVYIGYIVSDPPSTKSLTYTSTYAVFSASIIFIVYCLFALETETLEHALRVSRTRARRQSLNTIMTINLYSNFFPMSRRLVRADIRLYAVELSTRLSLYVL